MLGLLSKESCSYFRSDAGAACFGGLREGVRPCNQPVIGYLVIEGMVDGKFKRDQHPLCRDHWDMRKVNLGAGSSLVTAC